MRPMFRHGAALSMVAALALGAVATAGPPPKSPKSIAWQTDFKKGQATASKQKKLMMVDFYAEW